MLAKEFADKLLEKMAKEKPDSECWCEVERKDSEDVDDMAFVYLNPMGD